jgi:S-adenosylmethionine hydrolase
LAFINIFNNIIQFISAKLISLVLFFSIILVNFAYANTRNALVLQSDFSQLDGAVAAMRAVAFSTSSEIAIFDLTHEIEIFNTWEAAYRLNQVAEYWPSGTVFVSVVDPGVGTDRKSVVLHTKSGHYFVTPDNGTLTLVAEHLGIDEVREIDESRNRLPRSGASYTFHGRDVYVYTGARLAANLISFEEVGSLIAANEIVITPHQNTYFQNGAIYGNIPILDVRYGNVWSNITRKEIEDKLDVKPGDNLYIQITKAGTTKQPLYSAAIPYFRTFDDAEKGHPLAYINSLDNLSFALNQDSFASKYNIESGPKWKVKVGKITRSKQ